MGHREQIDDRFDGGVHELERKHDRDDDDQRDDVIAVKPQEQRGNDDDERDDEVNAQILLRSRGIHDAFERVIKRTPELQIHTSYGQGIPIASARRRSSRSMMTRSSASS